MVRTQAGFAVCSYGVSPHVPVRSSSRAGLLAGSECLGIGGLPHVAGVSRENVGYRVYTAQGILERITVGLGPLRHQVPTDPGMDSPLRADLQVTQCLYFY